MAYFAADDRCKLSFSLQMVTASGFAASVLFLLQMSFFAASGLAARGFAPNGLNLEGLYKVDRCE